MIDPAAIQWITPLGNLNPPDHTLPTDHIYFYFANPDALESPVAKRTTFYAPGDGTVTTVIGGAAGQESKLFIRQTSTFSYYVDHLILATAITRGTTITAGQVLGTTGSAYAVDLGVVNDSITVPFLNPARYTNSDSLHADAPLKYYTEPLRSQLYAKVQRLGADLDGVFNYDVAGRLSGNWFSTVDASPLVFAYDTYDPSRVRIANKSGTSGVFAVADDDPLPRDVTVASGVVRYGLSRTHTGAGSGGGAPQLWMLVQMTDDTHLRQEIFFTLPTAFGSNVRTFAR